MKTSSISNTYQLGHRQRVKEKFLNTNAASFREDELLELILFAAHTRKDVKPLAKLLLTTFGSLYGVMHAPESQLNAIDGVGESTILQFRLMREVALRMVKTSTLQEKPVLSHWQAVLDYCRLHYASATIEHAHLLLLSHHYQLIHDYHLSAGSVSSVTIFPREVVKQALNFDASHVILVHNHPSDNCQPSPADKQVTQRIKESLEAINIQLCDHLIVGPTNDYSFKSHGLL